MYLIIKKKILKNKKSIRVIVFSYNEKSRQLA